MAMVLGGRGKVMHEAAAGASLETSGRSLGNDSTLSKLQSFNVASTPLLYALGISCMWFHPLNTILAPWKTRCKSQ